MDRTDGAMRVYRDRQGKPVLIALTVLFLVCGLTGFVASQGWLW